MELLGKLTDSNYCSNSPISSQLINFVREFNIVKKSIDLYQLLISNSNSHNIFDNVVDLSPTYAENKDQSINFDYSDDPIGLN